MKVVVGAARLVSRLNSSHSLLWICERENKGTGQDEEIKVVFRYFHH